jgi:hypothetical protein
MLDRKWSSRAPIVCLSFLVYFATVEALPALIEWTGFSVTGRVTQIIQNRARVVILCDAPHWGIGATSGSRHFNAIGMLPANTELIPKVAAVAPIIIDGKRIRFDQLKIGQRVTVQYSIMEELGSLDIAARRIDGWTTAPTKGSAKRDR